MYFSVLSFATCLSLGLALPVEQRGTSGPPNLGQNFPDPSLIKDGDTWYAFSTTGGLATSKDFNKWDIVPNATPLKQPGSWAIQGKGIWAPDVFQRPDKKFVMHYTAPSGKSPNKDKPVQCVGVATADKVAGPYTAEPTELACPIDQGGAIDSSGFVDKDGSVWSMWKVDGNSIGKSTPIMLQKMKPDGITPDGQATKILENDKNDGPLVEAPSLVRVDDTYVLFFSSNIYSSDKYDTSYAVSHNGITNGGAMYEKAHAPDAPLLKTGDLYAPGGLDVDPDGTHVVFHADAERKWTDNRPMWAAQIHIDSGAGKVTLA